LVLEGHKLRSLPKRTRDLKRWMAEYGERAMRDIRRGDVVTFLDKLEADKGVNAAQSALVAFSSLATWYAVRDEQYETPVVRGMARVNPKEQRRHRTLTDDELRALWASTDTEHPYNCLVRFLLLTAVRLEEACNMKRQEVSADGVWTIPAERMKGKQPHVVPLSDWALDAFHRVPVAGVSPYVFTITGRSSISGYTKFKEGLDDKMGRHLGHPVQHWVHHDLRRTFVTRMHERGLAEPHIIEACLAHIVGGVKAHYNVASYFEAKKAALAAWANYVANILYP
jgi:integrase